MRLTKIEKLIRTSDRVTDNDVARPDGRGVPSPTE